MAMRIAHLVPRLDEGGVERTVLELCGGAALRGNEPWVVSCGGKLERALAQSGGALAKVDVASKNPFTLLPRARLLLAKLRDIRPDIVHVHSRIPAWLAKLSGVRREFPVVATVHGFNHVGFYSRAMTSADLVTVPCTELKSFLERNYGLARGLASIVPWGIDPQRVERAQRATPGQAGIRGGYPGGCVLAASVGRLSPRKGHDLFIRALALALQRNRSLCGAIVGGTAGTGECRRKLEDEARRSGIPSGRLQFFDAMDDVFPVYAAIDMLVVPSPKPEGFGRVALEAAAMDRPVIAARHGGLTDIIADGRSGLLFDPGDVGDLADKIVRAATMRWESPSSHVATFTLKRTLDAMDEVYAQCARMWGARAAQ